MEITMRHSWHWPNTGFSELSFVVNGWRFQAWDDGHLRCAEQFADEWTDWKNLAHPLTTEAEAEAALLAWAKELLEV